MKQSLLFMAALFMLTAAFAQQTTDPNAPPTSGRSTGSRQPGLPSPAAEDSSRVLMLSGKLVMADGAPLPLSVQVDLSCNGRLVRQANSSKDGNFTMDLSSGRQAGAIVSDASSSDFGGAVPGASTFSPGFGNSTGRRGSYYSMGRVDLSGCEVQVRSLPGYRGESNQLGTIGEFEGNIGNIYLVPLTGVTGATVSAKSLMAPQPALRELERARKELARKKSNPQKAVSAVLKAIKIYPDFAEAWSLLGDLRSAEHNVAQAREAFRRAIEIDPRYVTPYLGLTRLEIQENRWMEALQLSNQLMELNPHIAQGRYFHAMCHFQTGDFPGAEESIQVLVNGFRGQQPPPLVHYMMGAIHATRRDFTSAAQEFTLFLASPRSQSTAALAARARRLLADWEKRGLITSTQSVSNPN